jgi:AcrR family transcriptional regulator
MSDTKKNIIKAAINLFNEQGFANVRLQNIADEMKISVGNLAYHFKNKEAIVANAYEKIGEELSSILSVYRTSPDLSDMDHQLDIYYKFIKKYPFYFIDILEIKRNHPHLHDERKSFIEKMKIQFRKRIDYNMSRGIINPNLTDEDKEIIAENMCTIVTFWYTYQTINNLEVRLEKFKNALWTQLQPHLTKKGTEEFLRLTSLI